jgi:hypothetical protein
MTRDRLLRLFPPLVLGIPLLYLLVDRFDSVTSIVQSPRGLAVLVAIALGWVVLARVVLPRITRNVFVQSGVMTVVALGIVWFVVAQSYTDKTVIEVKPFPIAAQSSIATGEITGVHHHARGTARLYRQPDGTRVVGLEDIDIQAGPDYFVWIVPGADRTHTDGGKNLGKLRGNKGTQFYDIPNDAPNERPLTVLVWCRAFAVPVAHATPR